MNAVLVVGGTMIAANLVLVLLRFGYRARPSARIASLYWVVLRVAQSLAVADVVAVGVLYELGHHPDKRLFYLYAVLPIAVNLVAEDLRSQSLRPILREFRLERPEQIASLPEAAQRAVTTAAIQRQLDVMTIAAVVTIFLALRAITTANGI